MPLPLHNCENIEGVIPTGGLLCFMKSSKMSLITGRCPYLCTLILGVMSKWNVLIFMNFSLFHLNAKKLGVKAPQKVKFELPIAMLKYEKLPSTNSTKSGAH